METLKHYFEKFLESIPIEKYREELLNIKTVEQDLPKELNPLPEIYSEYWKTSNLSLSELKDYDKFFDKWWTLKKESNSLDKFIQKYFWGCSCEFIYKGFKARIYRTWISILTQFHFCYTWIENCNSKLEASAELDMKGIDALVKVNNFENILQIKKETYRPEARKEGWFIRKFQNEKLLIEIPYTIITPEQWKQKLKNSRKNKEIYELFLFISENLQTYLKNGFVVFKKEYPLVVEKLIIEKIKNQEIGIIKWKEVIEFAKKNL